MYIQITNKCNMTCDHCGMNCTNEGTNMSFKTFKKAINMSTGYVTLGGGEPTIHPQFEKFLLYAMANCENVWIITNGKLTETALMLAKLSYVDPDTARGDEILGVELSQDEYHDRIDPRVINAFKGRIRDTSAHLINNGRCDWGSEEMCICDGDAFTKPDGRVYQCGCDDSPCIGDVCYGFTALGEDDGDPWTCYKNIDIS